MYKRAARTIGPERIVDAETVEEFNRALSSARHLEIAPLGLARCLTESWVIGHKWPNAGVFLHSSALLDGMRGRFNRSMQHLLF